MGNSDLGGITWDRSVLVAWRITVGISGVESGVESHGWRSWRGESLMPQQVRVVLHRIRRNSVQGSNFAANYSKEPSDSTCCCELPPSGIKVFRS